MSEIADSPAIDLAKKLIEIPSITPDDKGCMKLLIPRLETLGFKIEKFPCDDVDNFYARLGTKQPLMCFAGHTDVVPTGPLDMWKYDPFEPTIDDGYLYGRGSADMKSAVAAFIVALESYLRSHKPKGSIALLITSAEEDMSWKGTEVVIEKLMERKEIIDYCLIGEASSTNLVGDVVRNGRRGGVNYSLTIKGIQGHIAYPHKTLNPIHKMTHILHELTDVEWDRGRNPYFLPTCFQVSNITAGTGADNVVPGSANCRFNLRYSTETTEDEIKTKIEKVLERHKVEYQLEMTYGCKPFFTPPGLFADVCSKAVKSVVGIEPKFSTGGGSSDGRYFGPTGAQIIELGLVNETVHKINECAKVEDINRLTKIYCQILVELLG